MNKINYENLDLNLMNVQINPTPIKNNHNMMNYQTNTILNYNNHDENNLNEIISENKKKTRGRKRKRVNSSENESKDEPLKNNHIINFGLSYENNFINFHVVKEENFRIFPKFTIDIVYNKTKIKISAIYSSNSKHKFRDIFIEKFSTHEQKERLNSFFPNELNRTTYICSFSLSNIDSSPEEMLNIISNIKLENKFAILSNKLKSDESLILIDSKNFFKELNENFEFSIFSINSNILSRKLHIQKSEEMAILYLKKQNQKNFSIDSSDYEKSQCYHYDIFSLENCLENYFSREFFDNFMNLMKKENSNLLIELKSMKEKENTLRIEFQKKEELYLNQISEIQVDLKAIQSQYRLHNDSLVNEIQILNKKLLESTCENPKKEISDSELKLDRLENEKSSLNNTKELKIQSDEKINQSQSSNISEERSKVTFAEQYLCKICLTNFRDSILDQCFHCVYCETCLKGIFPKKKNKKRKNSKNFIECPICKKVNNTFTTLNFS